MFPNNYDKSGPDLWQIRSLMTVDAGDIRVRRGRDVREIPYRLDGHDLPIRKIHREEPFSMPQLAQQIG